MSDSSFFSRSERYFRLSNFLSRGFDEEGLYWTTVEHCFQAQRFHDSDYREKIGKAKSPGQGKALGQLSEQQIEELCEPEKETGLQFQKIKRTAGPARVYKVLGILKGLRPVNLLDMRTGRGVFIRPLLNEFPLLPVICIDILDKSVSDPHALRQGEMNQLAVTKLDTTQIAFKDDSFDWVRRMEGIPQDPIYRLTTRFIR